MSYKTFYTKFLILGIFLIKAHIFVQNSYASNLNIINAQPIYIANLDSDYAQNPNQDNVEKLPISEDANYSETEYNETEYNEEDDFFFEEESQEDNQSLLKIYDPLQSLNQQSLKLHLFLNRYAVRPIAKIYKVVTPSPVRRGVTNFLANFYSPLNIVTSILMLDFKNATIATANTIVNTTFGFFGIFNPAASINLIPKKKGDIGIVLAKYKVPTGPYIMIPIIGPMTTRAAIGELLFAFFLSPYQYIEEIRIASLYHRTLLKGVQGVDIYANNMKKINSLYYNSIDTYTSLKSTYLQNRNYRINSWK